MKICIFSEIFWPQREGGAEISTRLGAAALAQNHDVCVVSLGRFGDDDAPVGEKLARDGYRIVRLPFSNAYLPGAVRRRGRQIEKALWHAKNLVRPIRKRRLVTLLQNEAPDLIYVQNAMRLQPAIFRAAKMLGIPVVMHFRDYGLVCARASMFRNGKNCEKQCVDCKILTAPARRASTSMAHAIAVSKCVRDRVQRVAGLGGIEWTVMHNTNTPRDAIADEPASPGRQREFTFGYLGAISTEKGVCDLVDAFSHLEGSAKLVVGGRGDAATVSDLRRRAKGNVEWLGHVDAAEVYNRADVVVVPSIWHEPQSRVLVEAATRGIPVIASRRGGSAEIVEGYRTGWTYDPARAGALLDLMRRAMQSEHWSEVVARECPGLKSFPGTAEESDYYTRLQGILLAIARQHGGRTAQ